MNYLGDILRRKRAELKLTQTAACMEIFGYRGGFLSDVERGHISLPLARVNDLARVLGETPEYWRRAILLNGALRRWPGDARKMHHVLELLADMHVRGEWDSELAFAMAGWLKERMGK